MAVHLNIDHTIGYLQQRPLESLDGLLIATRAKLKALGSDYNKRAHRTVKQNLPHTGNLGDVLRWVSCCDESNVKDLQTIDAVVAVRMANGGRTVQLGE